MGSLLFGIHEALSHDHPVQLRPLIRDRTMTSRGRWRGLWMRVHTSARISSLVAALLFCGCSHHLRLAAPATSPGARYTCDKGTTPCSPAVEDNPALSTSKHTTMVILPAECKGRFNEILVRDADSSGPQVWVTCAPEEEDIGTME